MKSWRGKSEAQSDGDQLFSNTRWSVVLGARAESTSALNSLCEKYRPALLIWLRSRQHQFQSLDPEDLVNGFFAEKLEDRFLQTITPQKGRFRTFLLACLKNYVTSKWRQENAKIRGGGKPHLSLDETGEEGPMIEPRGPGKGPDDEFDRAWGHTILGHAIARLEAELRLKGHLAIWEALQPHLYEEDEAPCFGQMAVSMNMSSNALYTATCRIRKRLGDLILDELRETVSSHEEFEEERKRFLELFNHRQDPGAAV